MDKIPTAEKFQINYYLEEHDEGGFLGIDEIEASKMLIDFAKLHVKAALEAASEKANIIKDCGKEDSNNCQAVFCRNCIDVINKESILNAYPLTNIK